MDNVSAAVKDEEIQGQQCHDKGVEPDP
jgi:hypothetical protein